MDTEYVPPAALALVAMALGDADRAFPWLEQGYEQRGEMVYGAKVAAWFDDFRSDPRFQALLKKMNFPASAESANG